MANKIYVAPETSHTWTDTGGDDALDLGGLASLGVRAGDIWDRGTGSVASWFRWRLIIDGFDTAPVVGEAVELYVGFSDGTNHDGDLSGTDGASSTVVLPNLLFLGAAIVQTTTAANELMISGRLWFGHRAIIPVVYNATADALLSTSDSHQFILEAVPPEIQ